ncbi:hypothetical protein [Streptomyces lavendofoliae]|uniref:Uncharacterized protein n=1 Tax=Streptomyces lavendofoliae TaxID=67314 RepID=A0A918M6P0_9ACTN|nr:hypothetical protein [Streptomyces lavendofoliae]GGU52458.1 hypothetical protein GCM10010274_46730 [Streptomyces lavendofoliae]
MTSWKPNRRDAKRFTEAVIPGKTYYSISECAQPWGAEWVINEHVFKPGTRWNPTPKCGTLSPQMLLANYGEIYDTPPPGLPFLDQRGRREPLYYPDPAKAIPVDRQKAGRR